MGYSRNCILKKPHSESNGKTVRYKKVFNGKGFCFQLDAKNDGIKCYTNNLKKSLPDIHCLVFKTCETWNKGILYKSLTIIMYGSLY